MIVLLLLFTIANCLILEKPDKYAGVYRHMTANFGIREGNYNITNKEIHVDYDNFHGCRLIKNAIGKLVLLMRGKCSFYKKALNVQRSGGVGMIVVVPEDSEWQYLSNILKEHLILGELEEK